MTKYRIIFGGEIDDEVFDTYEDAEAQALYYRGCDRLGAEERHMSNPGDYDYDEETYESPKYKIIEEDE